ncbi:rCG36154, isoform CRA_b [Rattus norvegicus]|uniref:RCG36154, isoform CRA_b n=1 Tax=Rattus norvegicus TaxID=10116 RepID=A6IK04_RAT|nr:rCG36154, isoform CRA_b [Rattus norvegicus]
MLFGCGHWVAPLRHICLLRILLTAGWGQVWNPRPSSGLSPLWES